MTIERSDAANSATIGASSWIAAAAAARLLARTSGSRASASRRARGSGASAATSAAPGGELGDVRLRRRDRPLLPCPAVDHVLGGGRQRRRRVVDDRDGDRAAGARRLDDGDQVRRPPRLRHGDHEPAAPAELGAVDRHGRRRGHPGRDPELGLDQVAEMDRGVVRRAAGDEADPRRDRPRGSRPRPLDLRPAVGEEPARRRPGSPRSRAASRSAGPPARASSVREEPRQPAGVRLEDRLEELVGPLRVAGQRVRRQRRPGDRPVAARPRPGSSAARTP